MINWLSILQGWAILLVVIGHAPLENVLEPMPPVVDFLYKFAYSFHMPLFAAISGYLFYISRLSPENCKKWPYWIMLKDKLKRLLIPGLFFTVVALIMKLLFPSGMERPVSLSIKYIAEIILFPGRGPLGEVWFIVALMWFFVLMPLWKFMLRSVWINVLTLCVLVLPLLFPVDTDFLCVGDSLSLIFYFALGLSFSKYCKNLSLNGKWCACGVGAVVLYCVSFIYSLPILTPLSGIVASVVLALLLDKYLPSSFKTFRRHYFQIFLMGIFFQIFVKMVYRHFLPPYWVGYVACIFAGIYCPVLISILLQKYCPKPLCMLFGVKKK